MSNTRYLPIPEALEGERADVALARLLGLSRSKVTQLFDQQSALLDGRILTKSDRLTAGILEVSLADSVPPKQEPPVPGGLPIIFQDDDIVVVEKPVGVAAHSSPGWAGPTVVGALTAAGVPLSPGGVPERQGIVQRLDVGTSGLMVVAKTLPAYSALKRAFKRREVKKIYHALVQGHPDPLSGTVDAPIARHPHADYKFTVRADGRASITHYEVLEMFRGASLLEIDLETGRTHQIRVHMSALRHPLVGDLTYGADPVLARRLGLTRQWLHARSLTLTHPRSGEIVTFHSEYAPDLADALAQFRAGM